MAFQVWHIYNYITEFGRQQAEIIQNHERAYVHNIGKSAA
jgi:hypothetical protein